MRLLLVHQNFPGQFRDLAPALCDLGHELKAIGSSQRPSDPRIEVIRYGHTSGMERQGIHALTAEVDDWIRRGEQAGLAAMGLRERGWAPDVILAHPGWGEAMLLRQIFPSSPMLVWPELWLGPEHMGLDHQPLTVPQMHYLRMKNWLVDGAMADAATAVLPTRYQANTFPDRWQHKIHVIHEGVPQGLLGTKRLESLTLSQDVTLGPELPVISFISRNLEPMRGFPTFMRSLPGLQRREPSVHVVVVGGDEVSYSNAPGDGRSWKQVLLDELEGQLDLSRIHFFTRLPHDQLIKLYRRSNLHVYLSNAFVLSWSLLEVMACGTPVLAINNLMLREVIRNNETGFLWQPDVQPLEMALHGALDNRLKLRSIGEAGTRQIAENYGLQASVQSLEFLCQELAYGQY